MWITSRPWPVAVCAVISTARPTTWVTTAWWKTSACARRGLEEKLFALEKQGKSVVLLLDKSGPLALFAVADTVKDSSREAIQQLHDLGIKTLMLTGDNTHTAQAIAAQVGIDQAQGDLLPTDKLQAIETLYGQGHRVGMVGDGIERRPGPGPCRDRFCNGRRGYRHRHRDRRRGADGR